MLERYPSGSPTAAIVPLGQTSPERSHRLAQETQAGHKPAVFPVSKDRPILFSALATADVLLTLDRADFGRLLGSGFYGLAIISGSDARPARRPTGANSSTQMTTATSFKRRIDESCP